MRQPKSPKDMIVAVGVALVLSGMPVLSAVLYTQDFESLASGDLNGQDGYTAMVQADVVKGAPDVTVTRDIGISSGLDTFFYFSGSANESDETMKVDNLRIGTTWTDVMPSPQRGTVVTVR